MIYFVISLMHWNSNSFKSDKLYKYFLSSTCLSEIQSIHHNLPSNTPPKNTGERAGRSPEPGPRSPEPGAWSPEPGAWTPALNYWACGGGSGITAVHTMNYNVNPALIMTLSDGWQGKIEPEYFIICISSSNERSFWNRMLIFITTQRSQ